MDRFVDTGNLMVAVIDDHEIIAHGVERIFDKIGCPATVGHYPHAKELDGTYDVAILDLSLNDGTLPAENLRYLLGKGIPTVVYTSADNPVLVREAIAHGALAIMRKTVSAMEFVVTVKAAARGEASPGLEWAAALDADEDFVATQLTPTEAKVLAMYASGELSEVVGKSLGMSPASVNTYISRIRAKYRGAGRAVDSRVDLFLRAAEDGLISYYGPES